MRRRTRKTTDVLDDEVAFTRFGPALALAGVARRHALAGAAEQEGPSLLALWEMPELAPSAVLLRRGHPGKGKSRGTVVRSVRPGNGCPCRYGL
jgi:hypothetical protein